MLLSSVLLTGCVFGGGKGNAPPPPKTQALAPRPSERETQICYADLSRASIRFSPLPDHDYGNGCGLYGTVQLIDIGLPVGGLKGMRCGLAGKFTAWLRYAVVPAAHQMLGSDVVRVETFGTYACRNVIGNSYSANKLSGHAIGNAVDVAGFVLADGRRIMVTDGWRSEDLAVRQFFDVIHGSACKRFGTVLSPDYNAAHYNHLHLEDDNARFCR